MKKFAVRKLETIKTTAALYAAGCTGGGGGISVGGGIGVHTLVP